MPRREAYNADITYGTNNEFGFDYLRDNMVWEPELKVQRELHYAIVDEVDNILVDEARTPLIISGPAEEANRLYEVFAGVVRNLVAAPKPDEGEEPDPDADVVVDEKFRSCRRPSAASTASKHAAAAECRITAAACTTRRTFS